MLEPRIWLVRVATATVLPALLGAGCGSGRHVDEDRDVALDVPDEDASPDPVLDPGMDVSDPLFDTSDDPEPESVDADAVDPGCPRDNPDWTVGLQLWREGAYEGYTLLAPMSSTTTYLIDMCGRVVHTWSGDNAPGNVVYLLDSGHLLRTEMLSDPGNPVFKGGGEGGRIYEMTWEGDVVWDHTYSSETYLQHHDVEKLPSGNVLLVAWEYRSAAEAVEAGRDATTIVDGELWPDTIVELQPETGDVVWIWRAWDHLVQDHDPTKDNHGVVEDHPELIDLNFKRGPRSDWLHINAVDYNARLDQIIVSVHNFSEVWVIDHSTSTEEAAGHTGGRWGRGGDLLYRWGNPRVYRAGTFSDQQLFVQHDAHWIPEGLPGEEEILIFNNGIADSSVVQMVPPGDGDGVYPLTDGVWGPDTPKWTYADPGEFFALNISGAQRLPGDTTLICSGPWGHVFEVTREGEILWSYVSPVTAFGILHQGEEMVGGPSGTPNKLFRAYRYGPDHLAFEGRDLTPGDYIELD